MKVCTTNKQFAQPRIKSKVIAMDEINRFLDAIQTILKGRTKFLDAVQAILKRDGKTEADLARELVSKDFPKGRSYNQVYDWLVIRKFIPRMEVFMELAAWYRQNIRKAAKAKVSAKVASTK